MTLTTPQENIEEDETVVSLVEAAPRIKIHTLETPDSCTHEVAVPPNFEFTGLRESVFDTIL